MKQHEIRELFEKEAENSGFWSRFVGSEFVNFLITFFSQVIYRAKSVIERRLLEAHISQALMPSSIRAHAQDRGYVPRKRTPTKIQATVRNDTDSSMFVKSYSVMRFGDNNTGYLNADGFTLEPHDQVTVELIQAEQIVKYFKVSQQKKFIEITLDRELSSKLADFSVNVQSPDSANYEQWQRTHLFRNTTAKSLAFVEFHAPTEQTVISFGDGVASGQIPALNSVVRVDCLVTDGFSEIAAGQELELEDPYLSERLTVTTGRTLVVGSEKEDIESVRKNAMYWTTYDNNTVLDGDYSFFTKNNLPQITWWRIWGESEQEKLTGERDIENMTKIFISVYQPEQDQVSSMAAIDELYSNLETLNLTYQPVQAKTDAYTINLVGKVLTSRNIDDVKKLVVNALQVFSDKSASHNGRTTKNEIWKRIEDLSIMSEFEITVSKDLKQSVPIDTFRFLDVAGSEIKITY